MKNYETVLVVKADVPDDYIGKLTKKIEKVIGKKPGNITKQEDWGLRRLAYPIKHEKKGRYMFWSYTQESEAPAEIERIARYEENVLRWMSVVVSDKKVNPKKEDLKKESKDDSDESYGRDDHQGSDGPFHRRRGIRIEDPTLSFLYRESGTLVRYLSEAGKIAPRRGSGCNAFYQRRLATALKRARQIALLPYTDNWIPRGEETA